MDTAPQEVIQEKLMRRPGSLLAVGVGTALLAVGVVSPYALVSACFDMTLALVVLVPPALAGLWLVPLLRLNPLPIRWHILIGAALGLGFLSSLLLVGGMLGLLHRTVWIGFLAVCTVAGIFRLRSLYTASDDGRGEVYKVMRDCAATLSPFHYAWLLVIPFAVLAILASSNATGFVWQEEGFAYDALEYHLQLPKEHVESGSIAYLPHNVYANLPAAVEMLFMLGMIVSDDIHDAGTLANMIHLFLGALTVGTAWLVGRDYSARAGVVCAVVMASLGWLIYLCGLAYVENGLLFFSMLALAAMIRFIRSPAKVGWVVLSGMATGFACGCKSTALPMMAIPLGFFLLSSQANTLRQRFAHLILFAIAVFAAFSPWLFKNAALTANPVFPLANSIFRASPPGWGELESESWNRGHAPPALDAAGMAQRGRSLLQWLATDTHQRLGPCILLLALVGLVGRRRDRMDALLLLMIAIQLAVWLFATHLLLRFAILLVVPLVVLCARAVGENPSVWRVRVIMAAMTLGAIFNVAFAIQLNRAESAHGAPASLIYEGGLPGFEYFEAINRDLPTDSKILLVGDAKAFYYQRPVDYCVTFNRNPFFEVLLSSVSNENVMQWFGDQGYSHLLIHWSEVRRLSRTYGFSPPINEQVLADRIAGLERVGLDRVKEFPLQGSSNRYVTLYAVGRDH